MAILTFRNIQDGKVGKLSNLHFCETERKFAVLFVNLNSKLYIKIIIFSLYLDVKMHKENAKYRESRETKNDIETRLLIVLALEERREKTIIIYKIF